MQGRIPREFIDELLQRLDIVEIIDRRVPLKKAGKDYKACCPFHDEKTPSFTVSPDKQFYHCFGCGASGTAITFLMEYGHLPFPEAVEDLASEVGLALPEAASPSTPSREVGDLFAVNDKANKLFKSQLRDSSIAGAAIDYLKGRGLSGEIAREFELGFAPESWDRLVHTAANDDKTLKLMEKAGLISKRNSGGYYDRFRSRIIFPIHDQRARVIGFGGRIVGDGEPKYLNSPETPVFHKGSELYNLHRAKAVIARKNTALVVEGYMDVVALAQFGIENAVAALGTATTRTHLTRLFRLTPAIVFCFDGDRAGRDAAWRALDVALGLMEGGRQVSFLFLPEGEDPDSIVRGRGAEAFQRMVEEATSLPDFLFSTLETQTDLSRLDGRARLVELAKPYLAKLPAGALQDLMWQRVSEISGVNHHRVRDGSARSAKSPNAGTKKSPGDARLSPMATAVSLIVQHPDFGRRGSLPAVFSELNEPGKGLLEHVIEISQDPQVTTAAIIERFRDTEHHQVLEKLAARDHLVEGDALVGFFDETMRTLTEKAVTSAIESLLLKSGTEGFSDEERQRLSELYSQRRQLRETHETA